MTTADLAEDSGCADLSSPAMSRSNSCSPSPVCRPCPTPNLPYSSAPASLCSSPTTTASLNLPESDWVVQLQGAQGGPGLRDHPRNLTEYVKAVGKSTALYQLGLFYEQRGVQDKAEQCFLQANSPQSLLSLGVFAFICQLVF